MIGAISNDGACGFNASKEVEPIWLSFAQSIFCYLNDIELVRCFLVCKSWREIVVQNGMLESGEKIRLVSYSKLGFGKEKVEKFFGTIGKEPFLPSNITEILGSPDPWSRDQTVSETHWLFLLPEKINEKKLGFKHLQELVSRPLEGESLTFIGQNFINFEELCNKYSVEKSQWILMKKSLVQEQDEKFMELENYHVPKLFEATFGMISYFMEFEKYLYADEMDSTRCYTRCEEEVFDKKPIFVGRFNEEGLSFKFLQNDRDSYGIAPIRRLDVGSYLLES